jgi:hypothetical protein
MAELERDCCWCERRETCCERDAEADCCPHDEACGCDAGAGATEVREEAGERHAAVARATLDNLGPRGPVTA